MKKITILLLCLTLLLCACGAGETAGATTAATTAAAATPTEDTAVETAGATTATEAAQVETTAAAETTVSDKELAESCVDKDVSELYALIGEPASSEYVSSCLGEGQDGNLYYDGFTVYTYKDETGEVVTFVE